MDCDAVVMLRGMGLGLNQRIKKGGVDLSAFHATQGRRIVYYMILYATNGREVLASTNSLREAGARLQTKGNPSVQP